MENEFPLMLLFIFRFTLRAWWGRREGAATCVSGDTSVTCSWTKPLMGSKVLV